MFRQQKISGEKLQHSLMKTADWLVLVVAFIAVFTLIGWEFSIRMLSDPINDLPPLNPVSAVCFFLSSIVFFLRVNDKYLYLSKAISIFIFSIGVLRFQFFVTGFDNFIDAFLFTSQIKYNSINRMSLGSALNFILLGVSFFYYKKVVRNRYYFHQYAALIICVIGFEAFLGYAYQISGFYNLRTDVPMSFVGAVSHLLLALALLFSSCDRGFMKKYTSQFAGSILAQKLIPISIIVPSVLGFFRLKGYNIGLFSNEFGTTMLVSLLIIIYIGSISYTTSLLNKRDIIRIIAENEVKNLNDLLEKKVIERTGELKKTLKEISDYKYALDASSIVAVTDQKGIIKYVNDNFCKISKYSANELIGRDHRIINSGYHSKEFFADLWGAIAHGKIWRGEIKNKAKDGSIYWVDTTIVPFLNELGKPFQYVAIRVDITEKKISEKNLKQSEAALRERDEQFRIYFEYSPAAVAMLDSEMKYILVSKNWMSNYKSSASVDDYIGKSHYEVFPTIPQRWKEVHQRCLAGASEKNDFDSFVSEDGTTVYNRWQITPWYKDSGIIGGIIIFW